MSKFVTPFAEFAAAITEMVGIGLITFLTLFALLYALFQLVKGAEAKAIYDQTRQRLGSSIILGLEFLVAADIIHTVAVELTFKTVGVLAIIVLIRTFLSFTLEVELTGRWPWQKRNT